MGILTCLPVSTALLMVTDFVTREAGWPLEVWSELGLRTDKIKNLHSWQGGRSRAEVEESVCWGALSPTGLLRLGLLGSVECW